MNELLEIQVKLAEYIADPARFLGGRDKASSDPLFATMDLDRLALMGRLTLDKRTYKMRSVLPKTFESLADRRDEIMEDFAAHYRPISLSGEQDARQFQEYLSLYAQDKFCLAPAIADLAALEIALWSVGRDATEGLASSSGTVLDFAQKIRRVRDATLLACDAGVRPLMGGNAAASGEASTSVYLAVAKDMIQNRARVFELNQRAFELLSFLTEWSDVAAINEQPSDLDELTALASTGLIQFQS